MLYFFSPCVFFSSLLSMLNNLFHAYKRPYTPSKIYSHEIQCIQCRVTTITTFFETFSTIIYDTQFTCVFTLFLFFSLFTLLFLSLSRWLSSFLAILLTLKSHRNWVFQLKLEISIQPNTMNFFQDIIHFPCQ